MTDLKLNNINSMADIEDAKANFLPLIDNLIGSVNW